ncbi:hydrogen peroxide-inducible genes activator, partial [Beggiatoa alba]|nr:hydrogen peroxide-inducible genes activator [Beggiatoa alba]
LYFKEEQTEKIYHQLMLGELDILLMALPYGLKNTEQVILFKDKFLLASRDKSRLVDQKDYKFNKLDSEAILLLEEGHCLRDHALAACKLRKPEKISRFSATTLYTLVQMVESDLGITFLPEMAVGSALLRGTKIKLTALQEKSYREIGLVWRKGSARAAEFKQLAELIRP